MTIQRWRTQARARRASMAGTLRARSDRSHGGLPDRRVDIGHTPARAVGTVGPVIRRSVAGRPGLGRRLRRGVGGPRLAGPARPGRRGSTAGWTTVLSSATSTIRPRCAGSATSAPTSPSATGSCRRYDGERVEHVLPRRSAFVRRRSFEGARAESDTLAANIDVVFLTHSMASPPNQRRLERELVLAFDSGAEPVVVLTKADLVDDVEPARREFLEVSLGVPVVATSGRTGPRHRGAAGLRRAATGRWPSSAPAASASPRWSTRWSGEDVQATTEVRTGDNVAATPPWPPSCWRCRAGAG